MSLNMMQRKALVLEDQRVKSAFDLVYDFAVDESIDDEDKLSTMNTIINLFEDVNEMVESGDQPLSLDNLGTDDTGDEEEGDCDGEGDGDEDGSEDKPEVRDARSSWPFSDELKKTKE